MKIASAFGRRRRRSWCGRWAPALIADGVGGAGQGEVASRICEALGVMHFHKIVQRDLKPQNMMSGLIGFLWVTSFLLLFLWFNHTTK